MYNKQLDIFIQVADSGSFTKAADQLFITSPAVMKQMNQLEKHVGVQLFNRGARGVTLTEAGKTFYKESKKIIRASQESIERVKRSAEADRYTIRIGNSLLCPYKPLINVWQHGGQECSKFKMNIIPFQDDSEKFTSLLASLGEDIDIIVAVCSSYKWESKCNFYRLSECPVTISIPRGHRLAGKKLIEPEDLHGERLLVIQRGDSPAIDTVRNYLESEHREVIIEDGPAYYDIETFNRCEQDDMLLLSFAQWADVHPSFVPIPVDWNFTVPFGVLCPENLTKSITMFLEIIGTIINEHGENICFE